MNVCLDRGIDPDMGYPDNPTYTPYFTELFLMRYSVAVLRFHDNTHEAVGYSPDFLLVNPVLGGDGTKIAPPGDIVNKPPG